MSSGWCYCVKKEKKLLYISNGSTRCLWDVVNHLDNFHVIQFAWLIFQQVFKLVLNEKESQFIIHPQGNNMFYILF